MIVKRLLRFALGPSFLEPEAQAEGEEADETRNAWKENRNKAERVAKAESDILAFLGLGVKRASHTGSSDGNLGLNAIRVQLPATFYILHMAVNWPISVLRCRIQTYRIPANVGYMDLLRSSLNPFSPRKIYSGLFCSCMLELANAMLIAPSALFPDPVTGLIYKWMTTWVTIPWNYFSLRQMLGTIDTGLMPSLTFYKKVNNPEYILDHWVEFGAMSLLSVVSELVKSSMCQAFVRNTSPSMIPLFLRDIIPSTLGDMLCIPLSTFVFRAVAQAAGMANACKLDEGINWTLLTKALAVEWLVAWSFSEAFHWLARLYVADDTPHNPESS